MNGLRSFIVDVPATVDPNTPIFIDYHGFTGTGAVQRVGSGLIRLVNEGNFIGIWPNGIGRSHNGQTCCGQAFDMNVDEVGFARAMVQRVTSALRVQPAGIFGSGISNGMAVGNRFACEAADLFDAIAGVSFQFAATGGAEGLRATCRPARPISYLEVHAAADTTVPFAGAPAGDQISMFLRTLPADQAPRVFAQIQGCTNLNNPVRTRFNSNTTCQRFTGCRGQTIVSMCTVTPGAHSIYPTIGTATEPDFDELFERFVNRELFLKSIGIP